MKPKITFEQNTIIFRSSYDPQKAFRKVADFMSIKYHDKSFKESMFNILNNASLHQGETRIKLQTGSERVLCTVPLSKLFDKNTGLLVAFWAEVEGKTIMSIPAEDVTNHSPRLFIPNVSFTKYNTEDSSYVASVQHLSHKIILLKNKPSLEKLIEKFRIKALTDDESLEVRETEGSLIYISHSEGEVSHLLLYQKKPYENQGKEFLLTKLYSFKSISLSQIRIIEEDLETIIYTVPKIFSSGDTELFSADAPGHTMVLPKVEEKPSLKIVSVVKDLINEASSKTKERQNDSDYYCNNSLHETYRELMGDNNSELEGS